VTGTAPQADFHRPPTPVLVDYIVEHRGQFGVEPICRVLSEHGCAIAPSTFYDATSRGRSRRAVRDEQLMQLIAQERETHRFVAGLGARKMWLRLRSQGHDVARCTVERLMGQMGITGVIRQQRRVRTTIADPAAARPTDLVDRQFTASRPNQLWVADFTYCPTWSGMVYVAFVFDVFSRRVLGWRVATRMTTPLVLDCLEQAIWTRQRDGVSDLTGLVHHTDAGSQYRAIAFTDRLVETGIDASVGSVGDAYDNALAESQIGLFKSELIWPHGPWRDRDHLEAAVLDWVSWFNTERAHESIDDLTPIQVEALHYRHRASLAEAG
jgi:putative transposase